MMTGERSKTNQTEQALSPWHKTHSASQNKNFNKNGRLIIRYATSIIESLAAGKMLCDEL